MTAQDQSAEAGADEGMYRFPQSAYLRGRKVGVKLAVREPGDKRDIDECEVETVWLRLQNFEVAAIEEEFGGVDAFDDARRQSPNTTLRRFFAIALGIGEPPLDKEALRKAGARLIDTEWPAYLAAVETLWMLAHGSPEEAAGKAWAGRLEMTLALQHGLSEVFEEAMDILLNDKVAEFLVKMGLAEQTTQTATGTSASRGASGRKRGRARGAASKSSGTT